MSEDLSSGCTAQKKHQPRQAGRKKIKKKAKNAQQSTDSKDRSNNPKAFAFNSGIKAAKMGQRAQEMIEKKLHVPLVDRTGQEPAPTIVAIVGPPGVGKSTLIKSLVKRYTKHSLSQVKGPITVVAGKGKRLTFLECNNDLNSMLDVAKIADLVLLLVDASFGFEMETFEFLNILQSHGFPKVVGVLTHLDSFKESKKLNKTKKLLKKRFWTEICDGAKVFYLSGLHSGARYPVNEILNLSRYLNTCKPRPLIWKNSHPYILADRIEDITNPVDIEANHKCDRKVVFYGYSRGIPMKLNGSFVHIPGVGDFAIKELSTLPDPCPFPEAVKKRTLNYKERLIYAPMSDVSGILYDKDAVYINTVTSSGKDDEGQRQEKEQALTELGAAIHQHSNQDVTLLAGGETLRIRRRVEFETEIEEEEGEEGEENEEEEEEYDEEYDEEEYDNHSDNESVVDQSEGNSLDMPANEFDHQFADESADELLVKTNSSTTDAQPCLSDYDGSEQDEDVSLHSKFIGYEDDDQQQENPEDASDGEEASPKNDNPLLARKEALKRRFDAEYDDDDGGNENSNDSASSLSHSESNYYSTLKESMRKQQQMNVDEFANDDSSLKEAVQGIVPGSYVRCLIESVPCEFIEHFNPDYPVLLGGLLGGSEMNFGYLQARIKNHRWHGKILKTNEPLVFSVGWRRFQSIPLFSLKDATRNRLLKYTPQHMHCMATFWGPIAPPNTGLLAFPSLDPALMSEGTKGPGSLGNFRVAATGVVLEIDCSVQIVKKLKLVGVPMEVHKNTAFIKDMFNSSLEVAKFEDASIRTVSGLRGCIKKAIKEPEGAFRATFEDKILMSDICFLKTWFPVTPKRYYNPLCNLLLADKKKWIGMRANSQVRQEKGISFANGSSASNLDSQYRPVERLPRQFKPLQIPKALQRNLPFASKPKLTLPGGNGASKRAVILEPEERKVITLVQQLATVKREHDLKREAKRSLERIAHQKKIQRAEAAKAEKHANKRKKIYIKEEQHRMKDKK